MFISLLCHKHLWILQSLAYLQGLLSFIDWVKLPFIAQYSSLLPSGVSHSYSSNLKLSFFFLLSSVTLWLSLKIIGMEFSLHSIYLNLKTNSLPFIKSLRFEFILAANSSYSSPLGKLFFLF